MRSYAFFPLNHFQHCSCLDVSASCILSSVEFGRCRRLALESAAFIRKFSTYDWIQFEDEFGKLKLSPGQRKFQNCRRRSLHPSQRILERRLISGKVSLIFIFYSSKCKYEIAKYESSEDGDDGGGSCNESNQRLSETNFVFVITSPCVLSCSVVEKFFFQFMSLDKEKTSAPEYFYFRVGRSGGLPRLLIELACLCSCFVFVNWKNFLFVGQFYGSVQDKLPSSSLDKQFYVWQSNLPMCVVCAYTRMG